MPAFDTTLTDQEKKDLVAYIQTGIQNAGKYSFDDKPTVNDFRTDSIHLRMDTVFSGVEVPWCIAFLPGDDMLITERDGRMFLVHADRSRQEVSGVPKVVAEGQGGLFDVLPDPGFSTNKTVYISYAKGVKSDSGLVSTTAVVSARLEGTSLQQVKEIFEAKPYWKTRHHYGGKLEFGRDGYLYITVGDRGKEFINPQSLASDAGKVHRIKPDGSIPSDNPFVNTTGARPTIFSYGHRNPQGMVMHPETGEIWTNEHGPRGGDEINVVGKALNYGWPVITYGINYDGSVITKLTRKDGMEQPLHYWVPSIGPSGMAFVQGGRYKGWQNAVLVGSLRFKYLNLCYLDGKKVTREETLFKNIGRLRDVRMGPDGYIYIAVEQPGYVFRLVPLQ
jgi:glucose/arabinose dehydrogenase